MNFVNLHHFSSRDTISQQLLLLLFFFFENEYISTIDGYKEATYFLNLTNKSIIKKTRQLFKLHSADVVFGHLESID